MATMTFSAGILFRRLLEAGWTRRKISYVLDISDAQVSRILNGYNPDVRIGTALAWANALHITLDELRLLGTENADVSRIFGSLRNIYTAQLANSLEPKPKRVKSVGLGELASAA